MDLAGVGSIVLAATAAAGCGGTLEAAEAAARERFARGDPCPDIVVTERSDLRPRDVQPDLDPCPPSDNETQCWRRQYDGEEMRRREPAYAPHLRVLAVQGCGRFRFLVCGEVRVEGHWVAGGRPGSGAGTHVGPGWSAAQCSGAKLVGPCPAGMVKRLQDRGVGENGVEWCEAPRAPP